MPREVYFQAASATVGEQVALESDAPSEIAIAAGTELQIRFTYKVYEQSKDEDQWTFRLTAQVEGEEEAVSERKHHDRSLFSDDVLSHVGLDLNFPKPGTFKIHYTATADLSRRPWNEGAAFQSVSEDTVDGEFTVHVQ